MEIFIVIVEGLQESAFREHPVHIGTRGADVTRIELYAKGFE